MVLSSELCGQLADATITDITITKARHGMMAATTSAHVRETSTVSTPVAPSENSIVEYTLHISVHNFYFISIFLWDCLVKNNSKRHCIISKNYTYQSKMAITAQKA